MDEVARLQSALRRKEADCEAVEAEIRAQIADYQRLKQRLLQQVRAPCRCTAHLCPPVVRTPTGQSLNSWAPTETGTALL